MACKNRTRRPRAGRGRGPAQEGTGTRGHVRGMPARLRPGGTGSFPAPEPPPPLPGAAHVRRYWSCVRRCSTLVPVQRNQQRCRHDCATPATDGNGTPAHGGCRALPCDRGRPRDPGGRRQCRRRRCRGGNCTRRRAQRPGAVFGRRADADLHGRQWRGDKPCRAGRLAGGSAPRDVRRRPHPARADPDRGSGRARCLDHRAAPVRDHVVRRGRGPGDSTCTRGLYQSIRRCTGSSHATATDTETGRRMPGSG